MKLTVMRFNVPLKHTHKHNWKLTRNHLLIFPIFLKLQMSTVSAL